MLGVLRPREVIEGPATRPGLGYEFATGTLRLPVYTGGPATGLATFAGPEVVVLGKIVDLSDEGFDRELWIGAIGRVGLEPQ